MEYLHIYCTLSSNFCNCAYTGEYTPNSTGAYQLSVTARDIHGNVNDKGAIINSVDPSTLPSSIPNTPPMIITAGLFPFDGATEINVNQIIEIPFTEPVVNVDASGAALYIKEKGADTRLAITHVEPELSPGIYKLKIEHEHLDFNKEYEIIITDQIRDLDNEALSNPMTITFAVKTLQIDAELEIDHRSGMTYGVQDQAIDEENNKLYLLDQWTGFKIINIENPTKPEPIGGYTSPAKEIEGHFPY